MRPDRPDRRLKTQDGREDTQAAARLEWAASHAAWIRSGGRIVLDRGEWVYRAAGHPEPVMPGKAETNRERQQVQPPLARLELRMTQWT